MDYIEVLKKLISIDTTVPPGLNYGKAIDFLDPLFAGLGFETVKVPVPVGHADGREGRFSLVCHCRVPEKPRLIFYGHIDVVPAEGWDAFSPRVEDGKIYGRGAADMKGGIAALLRALETVKGKPVEYDVSVMITTDEEIGQAGQLRYLKDILQPVSGAAFLNLDTNFGYVTIATLGAIQMEIMVKGESVHSALSHLGVNAVEKASLVMNTLLGLKKEVEKRKSAVPVHPDYGITRMTPRLNINMVKGGLKSNIVPDECLVSVDRRLVPEENAAAARDELLGVLSSAPGVDWEIKHEVVLPPVSPCEDPLVDKLSGIAEEITGMGGKYGMMGSGGLPQIVAEWGGREFGMGVMRRESNIHGKDEFARLQDIDDLAKIITRFLLQQ